MRNITVLPILRINCLFANKEKTIFDKKTVHSKYKKQTRYNSILKAEGLGNKIDIYL